MTYSIILSVYLMNHYLLCEPCSNKAANQNVPNAPPPASNNVIGNVITNVIKGLFRSEGQQRIHIYTLNTPCYSLWREISLLCNMQIIMKM